MNDHRHSNSLQIRQINISRLSSMSIIAIDRFNYIFNYIDSTTYWQPLSTRNVTGRLNMSHLNTSISILRSFLENSISRNQSQQNQPLNQHWWRRCEPVFTVIFHSVFLARHLPCHQCRNRSGVKVIWSWSKNIVFLYQSIQFTKCYSVESFII